MVRKIITFGARSRRGEGASRWRDPKRYLWLLGAIVPCVVTLTWLAVWLTGAQWLWWTGPLLTFVVIPVLDHLVGPDESAPPDSAYVELDTDRFYRWATYLYLPNQYLSLILACWLWSGGGWVSMSLSDKAGLMVAVGIIGGIGINAAHELGHKRERLEKRLSKIALAQTCYGHFFVEHNRGHHVHVATPRDPASAWLGETLYGFLPRSIFGGIRSAWDLESRRFTRQGKSPFTLKNDVLNAWLMSALLFAGLALWFRPVVLLWLFGQAIVGFCLLEVVNYIEHYGLRRRLEADSRYERVAPRHSWNSNTLVANVFLFHLQRHSDHHANPQRRYQTLRASDDAPELPGGYGTMFVIALFPPLWRRTMDPCVIRHYNGQIRLAALHPGREQQLLHRYADRAS